MKTSSKSDEFQVRQIMVNERGRTYPTYQVTGYIDGQRVRKRFRTHDQAVGEKYRLSVQAANAEGEIRSVNTRLTKEQVIDAEIAIGRLGTVTLDKAISWYLSNYKPPVTEMGLEPAIAAFLAEKLPHVSAPTFRNYRRTLGDLAELLTERNVGSITTPEILEFLKRRPVGKKRFNNLLGDLHAFFSFCQAVPREWTATNPVKHITKFRIARGVPIIITAQLALEVMREAEAYSGWPGSEVKKGSLVPYFSLCLFAGLRPSVQDGEIAKLGKLPDVSEFVDVEMGVVRITPDIAKTKSIRQIKIRSNLGAWLARYPLSEYPITVPNLQRHVGAIRKKFQLGHDVLRHTFISMHVAKFKSLHEAALEGGNSETMIRRHYLNLVSDTDAEKFWGIIPQAS